VADPIFHAEAEEAVISAVFLDPGIIEYLDLTPAEFYIDRHRTVFQAMRDLQKAGIGIDFVTLTEKLDNLGKLAHVGGPAGLAAYMTNDFFSRYNAKDYAAIIRDKAKRRMILQSANDLAKLAYSDSDIETGIASHFSGLSKATQSSTGAVQWGTFFDELFVETTERMENQRDIWGIPTGFASFDRVTGGLQSHELMVLSGEPGVGKTMLAMQMAANMADTAPGAIYSMEMTGRAVARRLVSARAQIETRKIKTGRIDEDESEAFTRAIDELAQKSVYMSESETWTTASLRADLTRLIVQHQIKWFVVDYLYLMNDPGKDEIEKTKTSAGD
jgi:replicative DNA helicase